MTSILACVSAFAALEACSSSSSNVLPGDVDASTSATDSGNTTNPGTDGGTNPGTDSGPNPGTDSGPGTCASPPKLFPPKPDGGMFCPFSYGAPGFDGGSAYCSAPTEMCCLSPSSDAGISDCETRKAACTNTAFKKWECSSPVECAGNAGGPVCCLTAGPVGPDPNCSGYQKTKGFDSTKCMAMGACTGTVAVGAFTDNQMIVCETQADCTAAGATGTTCTALKTTGTSIGLCL